jgi:hypothetical protein
MGLAMCCGCAADSCPDTPNSPGCSIAHLLGSVYHRSRPILGIFNFSVPVPCCIFVLPSPTNLRLSTDLSIGSNNHPPAGTVTGITIHSGLLRTVVAFRNGSIGSHWWIRFQRLISSAAHLKQSPQESNRQLASSCTVSRLAIRRDCFNCILMVSLQISCPSSTRFVYFPFLSLGPSKLAVPIICLEYRLKGSAARIRLPRSKETRAAQFVHRRILNPLFTNRPSFHRPFTLRYT